MTAPCQRVEWRENLWFSLKRVYSDIGPREKFLIKVFVELEPMTGSIEGCLASKEHKTHCTTQLRFNLKRVNEIVLIALMTNFNGQFLFSISTFTELTTSFNNFLNSHKQIMDCWTGHGCWKNGKEIYIAHKLGILNISWEAALEKWPPSIFTSSQ